MKEDFLQYLEKTSLKARDKSYIKSIFEYFEGDHPQIFSNRSFLFEGEPGIGKTFLCKSLISTLNLPTIFMGQSEMKGENITIANDIDDLLKQLEKFDKGIVYVDDLKYLFDFNEYDELDNAHRKKLMRILEFFRDNEKRSILIITLNDSGFFEESFKDRIDVKIDFDLPSEEDKLSYLESVFGSHVEISQLRYLAKNTIGYNYRDLPNVIRLAYFNGDNKIERGSIAEALKTYTPNSLTRFKVKQGINFGLKDLFIEKKLEDDLKRVITIISKNKELKDSNVARHNFFIFEGPAGVGKTHSVMAIAGELGIPLLKVGSREVYDRRFGLVDLFSNIKRFGNAIVLIDDADKVFQGDAMDFNDGGMLFADLNRNLDNLEEDGAIVIMSANDSKRFGKALRDRFKIVKFDYPSQNQRKKFFKNLMNKSKIKCAFNDELLISLSEGKNFRDMQRFWNDCVFYSIENKKPMLNEADFHNIFSYELNNKREVSMIG